MKRADQRLLVNMSELAVLVALHFLLIRWLAEKNVVAVLFSAGEHTPAWPLVAAGVFLLTRLLVVCFLPGIVLAQLAMWALARWRSADADTSRALPSRPPTVR